MTKPIASEARSRSSGRKAFPVTNAELVTLALPHLKGRTGDAAEIFKAYLAASGGDYATAKRVKIQDRATYEAAFRQFVRWNRAQIGDRRSKAANSRWEKKRRRKKCYAARKATPQEKPRRARPPREKLLEAIRAT